MTEKYCVDCKHFGYLGVLDPIPVCAAPGNGRDLVTAKAHVLTCFSNRLEAGKHRTSTCGPEAQYFEPKPVLDIEPGPMPEIRQPGLTALLTLGQRLSDIFLNWKSK